MTSRPSPTRSVVAGLLIAVAFFYILVFKLDPYLRHVTHTPDWMAGVLPNFLVGAVGPLVVFVSFRTIRFWEFVLFALLLFAGLTAYEFAQKKMPRRTYDPYDIVASGVGAVVAIGTGRVLFFRKRPVEPRA